MFIIRMNFTRKTSRTAKERKYMKGTLTLIGHASLKIHTPSDIVIYIDPYYEGDYSEPADIILSTHEHHDHNAVDLPARKADCTVLRVADTLNPNLTYNRYEINGVRIDPVIGGGNKNHHPDNMNGYLVSFDGITVYHAGDTAKIPELASLAGRKIDYAFYPIDGVYTMPPEEATELADLIGAKHNIPMHFFDADPMKFTPKNLLRMKYGETIEIG